AARSGCRGFLVLEEQLLPWRQILQALSSAHD
ncbi:MAG: hypothetical protein ACI9F9_001973, partial [Candidatus Paceibacteria bacterium]